MPSDPLLIASQPGVPGQRPSEVFDCLAVRTTTADAFRWGNKACPRCRRFRPLDAFHYNTNPNFVAERQSYCKACRVAIRHERKLRAIA